jgi:hypothetical protein
MTRADIRTSPGSAPPGLEPPTDLEARVVHRLEREGLLTSDIAPEQSMKKIHLAWGIAATVLLVAGLAVGRSWPEKSAPAVQESTSSPAGDKRPLFALMLYEDASYVAAGSHEDRVAEYTAWARSLAERGYLVDGAELASNGVLLAQTPPRVDAVPTSSQGVLAGYFIIRAADGDEAERIARECPHLKYQGTISLRPIAM